MPTYPDRELGEPAECDGFIRTQFPAVLPVPAPYGLLKRTITTARISPACFTFSERVSMLPGIHALGFSPIPSEFSS